MRDVTISLTETAAARVTPHRHPDTTMITALRCAVPYLRLYKGSLFVIHACRAALDPASDAGGLLDQIAILYHLGIRIVLVCGDGPADERILAACRGFGIDAVGDILSTDRAVVMKEIEANLMPVIGRPSSPRAGEAASRRPVDVAAAEIAAALGAEKLVFCVESPGILERPDDAQSLVSFTDLAGLQRLARGGGLDDALPKSSAIEAAIRGGVRRVHIVSCRARDALLTEIFTNAGAGTMIVADLESAHQCA